jgi:hypothetical protein
VISAAIDEIVCMRPNGRIRIGISTVVWLLRLLLSR